MRYRDRMTDFELDSRLETTTLFAHSFADCELRLTNDTRWPWLLLIPRVAGVEEWWELGKPVRRTIEADLMKVASALKTITKADKLNIATIGNIVPQMHIHVVARHVDDPNWPNPIWGYGTRKEYAPDDGEAFIGRLKTELSL